MNLFRSSNKFMPEDEDAVKMLNVKERHVICVIIVETHK